MTWGKKRKCACGSVNADVRVKWTSVWFDGLLKVIISTVFVHCCQEAHTHQKIKKKKNIPAFNELYLMVTVCWSSLLFLYLHRKYMSELYSIYDFHLAWRSRGLGFVYFFQNLMLHLCAFVTLCCALLCFASLLFPMTTFASELLFFSWVCFLVCNRFRKWLGW